MNELREVRSLPEAHRNLKNFIAKVKRRKTPLVLSVNGQPKLVAQTAERYQALLDRCGRAAEHCIFVDDRLKNLHGAQSLGFATIGFCSAASTIGQQHGAESQQWVRTTQELQTAITKMLEDAVKAAQPA